jgi:hypothetical protein
LIWPTCAQLRRAIVTELNRSARERSGSPTMSRRRSACAANSDLVSLLSRTSSATMPARALKLSAELRQQGRSVSLGPMLLGHRARHRPVRHRPDLVRLDWMSARRRLELRS